MTNTLRAFHDSQDLKDFYLARVRAHAAADRLIQGTGWEYGKGCAVGCTLEAYDHARYPVELGVPEILARLEDRIFEGLPCELAMTWPARFLAAMNPGADLSMVWARFAVWLLSVELGRWASDASRAVVALYQRRIAGDEPPRAEWCAARNAAAAAAYAAADVAADAAADAAYYAAAAACSAVAYADAAAAAAAAAATYDEADAAADAAAAAYATAYATDAARHGSIIRQSEKLLQLLAEAW